MPEPDSNNSLKLLPAVDHEKFYFNCAAKDTDKIKSVHRQYFTDCVP